MNLEQQLRAALAPCEPGPAPLAQVMARLSRPRPARSNSQRRRSGRIFLLGSALAVAAAAGILASRLIGSAAQVAAQVAAELPVAEDVIAAAPLEPVPMQPTDTGAVPATAVASIATAPPAVPEVPMPAPTFSFTVLVKPLQLDTKDAAVESHVREYYNALVDELRTVPGLVLIAPGAASTATTPADFRITVAGGDRRTEFSEGNRLWQITVVTEAWQDDAYQQLRRGTMGSGGTLWPCLPDQDGCGSPGFAARAVANLLRVFPSSPALDELRARNRAEEQARAQTQDNAAIPVNVSLQPGEVRVMEAETIRVTLERIAVLPAPGPRAALWLTLRGQEYPQKLPVLLKALGDEGAEVVRKELITQLALDFVDDPGARQALTAVAASEPQALPRRVAERALFGDGPWRDYVVATVRDTGLSVDQRLEPLNWMLDTAKRYPPVQATFKKVLPKLLEGDGARTLAGLLASRQEKSSDPFDSLAELVVARFSELDDPAVPELLVAYFDAAPSTIALRLLGQHQGDPRVKRKLEAIVAGDPDPELRQLAASYLGQAPR